MSTQTAVAIAGAGMISRHQIVAWSKVDPIRVIAIADPVREKAQLRAGEFGISHAFEDVQDMLDRLRPDILDIASPVETHVGIAQMVARHGIAVLCQKPVAPTLAEAECLTPVAQHVPFMVHENWRFRAPCRLA
jgi:predicted dehydrogenase